MLRHSLTRLLQLVFAKNAKNMINRFYRVELKSRCSFVVYCLTAAERFDQGNTRVIPYIRFLIEFKEVRNNFLEI